ncbi:glucose-6-phosphate isomerase [Alienimonas chondri]|uniref:Glucose-6-phosphate isomerase n=1 Tax=Alienimonas chondri TaxID=2681879 RepID=A0ABX1V934_9PLAN|nr:glucose-6-phosphate isomerase [Alienimonas chondri]NNJ24412.1 Glucose-6-phosphate isomerase B [Alienimonas chondri]
MPAPLSYSNSSALELLPANAAEALRPDLLKAREETLADVALFDAGGEVPSDKEPLDAGYIDLPAKLLATKDSGELADLLAATERFREEVDAFVSLGIGGSYMGLRALQEALGDPLHNEKPASHRDGPKLYYGGQNVDPGVTAGLLEHLENSGVDWGIVVISKSGGTLETALAFRLFREALEEAAGDDAAKRVIPVTGGAGSKLRALAEEKGYADIFPVPDGVGGRFSVLSAVGLVPAAALGLDVVALLQGAADMTERFKTADPGDNPVLDYVSTCHLFEKHLSMDVRILSTWGDRLEAVGLWYDQLLAESLGKKERGALPLTVVNTRDLHSRGQQHQEGKRDKLIHNLYADSPSGPNPEVPSSEANQDELNKYAGKSMFDVLTAARQGTDQAYAEDRRPTADIILPTIDAYAIGQLLQMLMLATTVEGRLIGINPYGQPGVEAYKRNMNAILSAS